METGLSSPGAWDPEPDGSSFWNLVQKSGIEWGEVDERPDGLCTVTRSDGQAKVTFGHDEPDGGQAGGWTWGAWYHEEDGYWAPVAGDWAEDDDDMAAVLKRYLAYPGA